MFTTSRTVLKLTGAVALVLVAAGAAEAGPPLICRAFDTGNSALLPWRDSPNWKSPEPTYDVQQLTADTMRLLNADAPILARMENMRRATIYAAGKKNVAAELLAAVVGRTTQQPRDPLAWFDAGYLVESYRQAKAVTEWDMLAGAQQDGYSLVRKAIALAGSSPDMEFAASLMTPPETAAGHRRRAQAGAKDGSLLAKNLEKFSL
jgi:hypothetical protein